MLRWRPGSLALGELRSDPEVSFRAASQRYAQVYRRGSVQGQRPATCLKRRPSESSLVTGATAISAKTISTGPGAWRAMYLIGTVPAFLTLPIRHAIPESALWERAKRTSPLHEQGHLTAM